MSNPHSISAENILRTLPDVLRRNEKILSLAESIAKRLAPDVALTENEQIYNAIDALPEAVIDGLAYDFKIDWWDSDYSLEQKRQVLRDNWYVHRYLGTKASIERSLAAIYPNTRVLEWFEYNGKPYFFKLLIDVAYASITPEQHQRVIERVSFYKNLRSHMEEIEYTMIPEAVASSYAGIALSGISITLNAEVI